MNTIRRRFVPLVLGLLLCALLIGWVANRSSGRAQQPAPSTTQAVAPRAASPSRSATRGPNTVAVTDLPSGARRTLYLVDKGGPYPYRQDNSIYQNRNGALPAEARGYYHEYTVRSPDESDRGPRRIVVGRDGTAYYTADHYTIFRRVLR